MMIKQAVAAVAILASVIVAGAIGYGAGTQSERVLRQPAIDDALMSSALTAIRFNIQILAEMRQKKYVDTVKDMEYWTILKLQVVDPAKFVKGGASEFLYPQTLDMVNAYHKQFPDTEIDPRKNPTIAKAFGQ